MLLDLLNQITDRQNLRECHVSTEIIIRVSRDRGTQSRCPPLRQPRVRKLGLAIICMMARTNTICVARWESPWGLCYFNRRWRRHERDEGENTARCMFVLYGDYASVVPVPLNRVSPTRAERLNVSTVLTWTTH